MRQEIAALFLNGARCENTKHQLLRSRVLFLLRTQNSKLFASGAKKKTPLLFAKAFCAYS